MKILKYYDMEMSEGLAVIGFIAILIGIVFVCVAIIVGTKY